MTSTIILITLTIVGILGHVANGVPLEKHPLDQPYDPKDFFTTRIVGGTDAPKGLAPHMMALVMGEIVTSLVCGGSLISRRHALTAAHCIEPLVVWGTLTPSARGIIGTNVWQTERISISFSHHANHPDWDRTTIDNDVGVLFLAEDLPLGKNVAIVPLEFNFVGGGEECFVTGWGRIELWGDLPATLQYIKMWTLSPAECAEGIREAEQSWGLAPPLNHDVEICARHSPGHGMCHGDSGSALVSKKSRKQVGIVSWGFPCALGAPDMFARISGFSDFLKPILSK